MAVLTVLGAGAMGSALAAPLDARGHDVRLWGTWLDDELIESARAGLPHPRTGVPVPRSVRLFSADRLDEALDGADHVFLAVSSEGVEPVLSVAAPRVAGIGTLSVLSKGLAIDAGGTVGLLPDAIADQFRSASLTVPALVAIGGPCKANEVAAGRPTATVYASTDSSTLRHVARDAQTDSYRIATTDDVVGLEIAAPLKNVYAIALGYADGLTKATDGPWHDLKAAAFAAAVGEMAEIAAAAGGRAETVFGLAGTGDLEVTGLSGRNRLYGERIGAGEDGPDALAALRAENVTVEGASAAPLAVRLAAQLFPDATARLPLLHAVQATVAGTDDPLTAIAAAVLPRPVP